MEHLVLDVSALVPEARSIVQETADVYLRHLGRWFIGLAAYGSTVNGGAVPGLSDIDLALFLEDSAFTENGDLPLDLCLTIRRDTSRIETMPFRCVQCFAFPRRLPEGTHGPITPGCFHILAGTVPVEEVTAQQLRDKSRAWLANLTPPKPAGLLFQAGKRLWPDLRELYTWVWEAARSVVTLQQSNVIAWGLGRERLIEWLPQETPMGRELRAFQAAVRGFYPGEESVEHALEMVEHGVVFLREVKCWWTQHMTA